MKSSDIVLILVVVGAILVFGGFLGQPSTVGTLATTAGTPPAQVISCESTTTPELALTVFDAVNTGSSVTDLNAEVYLNNSYDRIYGIATDATIDAIAGSGYKIYLLDQDDFNYTGTIVSGNVTCAERIPLNPTIEDIGSVTIRGFNSDDSLINSSSDAQAIAASQTVIMDAEIEEDVADDFYGSCQEGAPPLLMVIDANYVGFKKISPEGINATAAAVPNGHVVTAADTNHTGSLAYSLNDVQCLKDFEKKGFKFKLEATTQNPCTTNGGSDAYFKVYIYTPVLHKNTETGSIGYNYRDPNDNSALYPAENVLIYCS